MPTLETKAQPGRALGSLASALALTLAATTASPAFAVDACSDPSLSTLSAYALGTNNTLSPIRPGFASAPSQVVGVDGNLIGIDFRPSDRSATTVYGLTDTAKRYLIDVSIAPYRARLVSTLSPRFAGGYQSLADFNPTGNANALRLIGSNDQNFAVVNRAGILHQTVVQNRLQYAAGDANFGVDPSVTAGAYDTNVAGALSTTFYMIDYDLDTLVTIAGRNPPPLGARIGSSNTASGMLKTIGPLVDEQGKPLNFAPAAGLDIYTNALGADIGFAVSGQDLYCIDLAGVNADLPIGTQQKVVAQILPDYNCSSDSGPNRPPWLPAPGSTRYTAGTAAGRLRLHQRRPVAAVPERARAPISALDLSHVAAPQGNHQSGNRLGFVGSEQQVIMVWASVHWHGADSRRSSGPPPASADRPDGPVQRSSRHPGDGRAARCAGAGRGDGCGGAGHGGNGAESRA